MYSYVKSIFVVITLFFLLTGCTTKVTNKWIKSDYSGKKFNSILVVGVSKDKNNKVLWENVMADNLRQNGVGNVITSTSGFPGVKEISRDDIVRYINENNINGVLITRLVDIKRESAYHPPSGSFYSGGQYAYYTSFPSYYRHAVEVDIAAGQRANKTTVQLETTLYESATEELVWSMSSDTFNPNSVDRLANEVSSMIIRKLKEDQLI